MTYSKDTQAPDSMQHDQDDPIRHRSTRFRWSDRSRQDRAGPTFHERAQQGADAIGVGSMSVRKQGSGDVMAKLAHADALAAKGMSMREISAALNISVMTYYRWRKMRDGVGEEAADAVGRGHVRAAEHREADTERPTGSRIKHLESENGRLRQLIVDLLLEKSMLEEKHRAGWPARVM